ncbi:MAG TPA: hypothetical protein VHY37_03975 [Tepidisphaeraceae bacterium]|jgi:anti-sigma factor RsiW|nr:hypothetical protein [Tepidisphaeraceae bacterium]
MISEMDQKLLDEYLDGQLPPVDAQRLTRRLALEPALGDELSALRAAREIRQNVFAAIAPEPAEAEQFAQQIVSASRRQALRARVGGMMRIGGGVAASIAIGFIAGWIGRGRSAVPAPASPAPLAVRQPADHEASSARTIAASGQLTGPFQVSLTDPSGRVLAVQKFDRLEDAAVAADAMQHRVQSNASSDAEPVVYAGQF